MSPRLDRTLRVGIPAYGQVARIAQEGNRQEGGAVTHRLSQEELDELGRDPAMARSLRRFLPLRRFLRDCLLPDAYSYPDILDEMIVLTAEGAESYEHVRESRPSFASHDVKAAVFAQFAHLGLLIDLDQSDADGIQAAISREVRDLRILYPFVFGRQLYDKYFDTYGAEWVELTHQQSKALVEGTPQGVFQTGAIASGPLGLIRSVESRYLPPVMSAALAHCVDPGCSGIHGVGLQTGETPAQDAFRMIALFLRAQHGAPSWWDRLFSDILVPDSEHYSDVNPRSLAWLIGNALSDEELRTLVGALIELDQDGVRTVVREANPPLSRGSAEEIVGRLDPASCLQVMLMFSNETISSQLDQLVSRGNIVVPLTEVRRAPYSGPWGPGPYGQTAELSTLGLRFVAPRLGIRRLRALLRRTHTEDDLAWLLIGQAGETLEERLECLVQSQDVRRIVSDYVLSRRDLYEKAADYLRYGHFPVPTSDEERQDLILRILWKLGFDVPHYPDTGNAFRRRLSEFSDLLDGPLTSEDSVERARSVGVNVFVSLEEVLSEALAFAAFALLFDHYGAPRYRRFTYRPSDARQTMVNWLDGSARGTGEPIQLNVNGKNNLYSLVHGFRELRLLITEIRSNPLTRFMRPREQHPLWARHSMLSRFPFVHTIPVLDLVPEKLDFLLESMERVARLLLTADVMGVRNRVPHGGGGEFPSETHLRTAVSALDETLEILENTGMFPLVQFRTRADVDQLGRMRTVLSDYREREHVLFVPGELDRCGLPAPSTRQVVFRSASIGGTADVLRFVVEEDSAFTALWQDYPRQSALDEDSPADAAFFKSRTLEEASQTQ
jgi:hypothetical protein